MACEVSVGSVGVGDFEAGEAGRGLLGWWVLVRFELFEVMVMVTVFERDGIT